MAKKILHKHPLTIRWLHWINFPLMTLMIWSGLLIYWANGIYGIKIFSYELFHLFPAWFYEVLGIPFRLAEGLTLHFFFMWFFIINGVLYIAYTTFSGEWRTLIPVPGSFKRALQVTLYDLGLSKYHPPQGKYNDAQRIAYTGVIFLGIAATITGLAIYKPTSVSWLTTILGGYEWARFEHFWVMNFFFLFFLVHVSQVAKAGWNNFRSMITGYEVLTVDGTPIENGMPQNAEIKGEGAKQ
ncbi:MAG: cytochrome b/b6 domain-containing protein [Pyrinomonadaceae bacterium]|nr:cytochrome b/b6 domain-containing protein [Pyrinomonadaceae bacterium]